jgi:ArsR family transcriptional regulator, lead/cadmium/zinc/bismuth-responsive transcriptional repressor
MKCSSYFFNVISNKTRWKIINSLYDSEKCVKDICTNINEEQSKVSHNLKILFDCNFVFYKKKGTRKTYYLNKKTVVPLLDTMKKHMKEFCNKNCVIKRKGIIYDK